MTQVRAIAHGYFGGVLREPGDTFEVPDELWADEKRRPKWCAKASRVKADEPAGDPEATAERPKRGTKAKAEKPEPFDDAPEPIDAKPKGNGVKEALGVEPDWVAPKQID